MSELSRSPVKLMESVEVLRPFEFRSKRELCIARKKPKLASGSPKYKYCWLLKSMDGGCSSCYSVIIEVISQELRRLLDGGPKTRISLNIAAARRSWGVLSKFIPGFISYQGYETNFYQQILRGYQAGTISGLGGMLVLSLWLGEIDLKLANFGYIDTKGIKTVVHVDGDCSFASLQKFESHDYNHNFNFEDVNALPALKNYHPHNWLNTVHELNKISIQGCESRSLEQIRENSTFKAEVLKMVLFISILPDSFIDRFVKHYSPCCRDLSDIKSHLKDRRDIFYRDLAKIEGFREFVLKDEAEMAKLDLLTKINSFYMYSKVQIFDLLPIEKSLVSSDRQPSFKCVFKDNLTLKVEYRFYNIEKLFIDDSPSINDKRQKI